MTGENGLARVKIADLGELLNLYGVPDSHRADLIALAKDSRATDPVDQLEGHLPEGHARILQAESEARDVDVGAAGGARAAAS
jgi:hypothetical protein